MKTRSWGVAILLTVALSACGSLDYRSDEPRYDRYRISEVEIDRTAGQVRNLYQLVERLRPHWLDADVAFQDQVQLGAIETLGSFDPRYATSLVYLDGSEAGARLPGLIGTHITGAIVLYR